jgi:Transcription factor WhiB
MTATDGLNRALSSLAAAGDRPRCADPITRELWTAELAAHRAIAVKWCKRCPVLVLCRQAAEERDEQFGVWGGVDRSIRPSPHSEEFSARDPNHIRSLNARGESSDSSSGSSSSSSYASSRSA